jgi:gamma-glutamylcyclotransferase
MAHRCPSVKYLGIGRLRHWHWQINERGYANIVEEPPAPYSPATARWLGPLFGSEDFRDDNERVYGFVYKLDKEDEEKLDSYEDVPNSYTKEWVYVDFWARPVGPDGEKLRGEKVDIGNKFKKVRTMVYVDRNCTTASKPNGSYIYKMNEGIQDAIEEGVPQEYIDECVRPYIPVVDDQKTLSVAIEDAIKMGIDVKKMIEDTENRLAETGAKAEGAPDAEAEISQEKLVEYLKKMMPEAECGSQVPSWKEERRRRTLSLAW